MATETPAVTAMPAAVALPTVSDVCPRGDVFLVCGGHYGDGRILKVRVSSAVLNLSSKVFQTMLRSMFKEGTDLLEHTSATPLEIELADDDPQAMEAICDIVHLRNSSFAATNALSPSWVLRIGLVADKYDFIRALKLVSGMWLNDNKQAQHRSPSMQISFPPASPVHFMLAAAHLFRNRKAFGEYGKRLIFECSSDISAPASYGDLEPIRNVLVVLEQEKVRCQGQLTKFIECEIQKPLSLRKSPGKTVCDPTCNFAGEFTLALMDMLVTRGLWPVTRIRETTLHNSLLSIANVRVPTPLNITKCCNTKNCELANSLCSSFARPPLIPEFQDIVNRLRGEIRGPCLQCFVDDKKVELSCRKHPCN